MNISISVPELAGFQNRMGQRADRIKSAVQNIIKKSVYVVEKYGKIYSPVDTGRMRASISEGISIYDRSASVGPTVEYAKYVHRRVPFMSAAAEQSMTEINQIAQKEVHDALK